MRGVAERLESLGTTTRTIEWRSDVSGGDTADVDGTDDELRAVTEEARG